MVTVFMPYMHKFTERLRLASILSFGYGDGEYDRGADRESDITDIFYGFTNELRYTINLNGFAELEPALMLNAIGYTEDGFEEDKGSSALISKKTHNNSVEAGVGLFLKKNVTLSKFSRLNMKIGGAYYREFADPYDDLTIRHRGAAGWYKINDYAHIYDNDRALLEAALGYEYKKLSVTAKYNQLIQRDNPSMIDVDVRYNF
jgi:outer membrane autotransporter protein